MEAALNVAGVSLRRTIDWHHIVWRKVYRNVSRLQVRIVKAFQEGKIRKARALQIILTRSFGGKALAVRRVTENKGKRTPGTDGEIWNTPEKKTEGIQSLRLKGYRATPLRRIYIPKSNNKRRPLGIPVMKDRAMQALYKLAVEPIAEETADCNSYGFRLERSTADAIEQVFTCLSRKTSATWILEGDIKSCFDRISHEWLLDNVPMNKNVLEKWLRAGFIENKTFRTTEEGTPQGGIISPILANMALDGLEQKLKNEFSPKNKVHFIRFADDFITTGATKELLEERVVPIIREHIKERGLSLSEEKTKITHIRNGFDFLGHNVRKFGKGKLIIRPSKKNFKNFLDKVRKIIRKSHNASPSDLICKLNPVIRGWANYQRHVISKAAFGRADFEITGAIWRAFRRKHPKKSRKWVKNKYFRVSEQGRDWCFFGRKNGKEAYLFHAMKVPIRRHIKIKGKVNPYDPEWEDYLKERKHKMTSANFRNMGILELWKEQDGKCPVCNQAITIEEGWHNHHIKWKIYGGSDESENRILMHPNCHRQVHSLKLEVEKPCPQQGH
ncbi:group II intron reverse transcriptase/maturase [Desulfococcaceae bacterium HSG8]|nr:group II intron reverse transcriptase/maturase [Desulfococcaceae bacterium HSG8]